MIQHVTLEATRDAVPSCVAFYALLGFHEVTPPDDALGEISTWVERGPYQVHLLYMDEPAHMQLGHVAMVPDDYESAVAALEGAGHQFMPSSVHWGAKRGFVRDPAGNLIELMEFPPPTGAGG